jgi:hypothetical protein
MKVRRPPPSGFRDPFPSIAFPIPVDAAVPPSLTAYFVLGLALWVSMGTWGWYTLTRLLGPLGKSTARGCGNEAGAENQLKQLQSELKRLSTTSQTSTPMTSYAAREAWR